MKWKARIHPKDGDLRWVKRFAFLPTRVKDSWIWLEYYIAIDCFFGHGSGDATNKWIEMEHMRKLSKDNSI